MQRISVVGNSGSGKTTIAQQIASRLDLPHLELDSVNHLPGWIERDVAEFRDIVAEFSARDRWVIDGNYRSRVGDLVWARADTVVWLDLSRWTVMTQMTRRTVRRVLTRQQLWNGNRERLRDVVRWAPERSIVRWAWTQHSPYRQEYAAAMNDGAHAALTFIRLTSQAEVASWLDTLPDARP